MGLEASVTQAVNNELEWMSQEVVVTHFNEQSGL